MLSARLFALVLLAWSLAKAILRRFVRRRSGLRVFLENYEDDRLGALEPQDRRVLPAVSGCVACGRCDIGEGDRIMASDGAYPGLMRLVLASSRSMPDFDAALRGFAHVPDQVLRAKVGVCPVRLPFPELAALVRRQATVPGSAQTNPR